MQTNHGTYRGETQEHVPGPARGAPAAARLEWHRANRWSGREDTNHAREHHTRKETERKNDANKGGGTTEWGGGGVCKNFILQAKQNEVKQNVKNQANMT